MFIDEERKNPLIALEMGLIEVEKRKEQLRWTVEQMNTSRLETRGNKDESGRGEEPDEVGIDTPALRDRESLSTIPIHENAGTAAIDPRDSYFSAPFRNNIAIYVRTAEPIYASLYVIFRESTLIPPGNAWKPMSFDSRPLCPAVYSTICRVTANVVTDELDFEELVV